MSRVIITPTTPESDLPQFLTVKQAAAYTQQCEWTIREAVKHGLLRVETRFGRKLVLLPREQFVTHQAEAVL